jgi:hypothetical protein
MSRIPIATDAWRPQVNGVTRSLESLAAAASAPRGGDPFPGVIALSMRRGEVVASVNMLTGPH